MALLHMAQRMHARDVLYGGRPQPDIEHWHALRTASD
jgi:hypothetical protein